MIRKLLILVVLVFGVCRANAQDPLQDYVLEERGDTLVIADFFDANVTASTLGAVIAADDNAPDGRVYMLHAGSNGTIESGNMALYLSDAAIPEQGRPLTIVGEDCGLMVQGQDTSCRPPTIAGYQDAAGNPVLATIAIDDDLTMKNLHFTSAHTQGQANWSFVDVNGDNRTVRWENVLGEHNRWVWINSNGNPGTSLYITDSYFVNATDQPSRRNGGVYDDVGDPTELVWVENTTHVENAGMQYKFRSFSPSQVIFNHNTFVNAAGQLLLSFGYFTNLAVTNNLFVNSNYLPYYPGLDRSEMYPEGTAEGDFQPHGIINLSPLPTNDTGTYVITPDALTGKPFDEADREILVDANAAYWDSQLLTIAQDLNDAGIEGDVCEGDACVQGNASLDWTSQAILANDQTTAMFNDAATYPKMTWGTWYDAGAPGFAEGPGMVQQLYDWGYDSANSNITVSELMPKFRTDGNEAGNEIDNEDNNNWIIFDWPIPLDLSYTNQTYLAGGYNGYPLGDLNWFPAEKTAWMAERDAEYTAIESALDSGNPLVDTAIEEVGGEIPSRIQLNQNYPNPFNPTTTIQFALDSPANVELVVYDVLGRRVASLVDEQLAAGTYKVDWNAATDAGLDVSSGVYVYTLRAGDHVESKQMVLMK